MNEVSNRTCASHCVRTVATGRERLSGLLIATMLLGSTILAAGAFGGRAQSAPAGSAAFPAGCAVVADGLNSPRGVAVAPDGTLYVSEAGTGGDESIVDPTTGQVATARGLTGQVTAVTPDGARRVVASGFPSYLFGGVEYVGPAGIVATEETLYLAVGGAGPSTPLVEPMVNEDTVVAIDLATGAITPIADIGAIERTVNPDPHAVDSNLYGLARAADGTLFAADAGGNAVYRIDPGSGEPSVLAVVPGLPLAEASAGGNPARGGANEIDPVTTSLTITPDGALYLGLLSGGPFPAGGAKVLRVGMDGALSDAATGLTMVVGLASAPDGTLYATQISTDFLAAPPAPGNVVRLLPDGSSEIVLDGLNLPNGIAFDGAGNLYVVVDSVNPIGEPPIGKVLRCEAISTAPGLAGTDGTSAPDAPTAETASADVTIALNDIFFAPTEVTIPADAEVTIRLENLGVAAHDLTIDELGVRSAGLGPGESAALTLNAPAGTYTVYCSLPGHRAAGMVGTLVVE